MQENGPGASASVYMMPKWPGMKPTEAARRSGRKIDKRKLRDAQIEIFELLYNELEQWRQKELAVAGTKEQRTDILNQQTRALATIGSLTSRSSFKAGREKKIKQVMSLMGQPKKWEDKYGGVREVHTQFTVLKLKSCGTCTGACLMRLGTLMKGWRCSRMSSGRARSSLVPSLETSWSSAIGKADLLNRGRSAESMVNLRRRLTSLFRQFVDTPEFNPEATGSSRCRACGSWHASC